MQLGNWQFSPGIWPTLATILLLPLLLSLGFWQLDRAEQKSLLQQRYLQRGNEKALSDLQTDKDLDTMIWRRVHLSGNFNKEHTFLLDNQILNGQAGYFVYNLFEMENELPALVNRGWIRAKPDRKNLPEIVIPLQKLDISGVIKKVPATGILLAEHTDEELGNGLYRIQQVNLDKLATKYKISLLPYVIRMDAESVEGYARDWREPGSGKEKHLGYAFQWFAMSSALIIIFLVVNLKKKK